MNAENLVDRIVRGDDQSNLCVVLRAGETGLEAVIVADELSRWSLPGGHAEAGETRAQACVREVYEETGLEVEVEPLILMDHTARQRPAIVFYAVVEAGSSELKPGGGDVHQAKWVPVNDLGNLNGTDRLAIALAARRVCDTTQVLEEAAVQAENEGYPVARVLAPTLTVRKTGTYARITDASAVAAFRLKHPGTLCVSTTMAASTYEALERAHRARALTPLLEALLIVSDALWRYDSQILPVLVAGGVVVESGPPVDWERLHRRGLPEEISSYLKTLLPVNEDLGDADEDEEVDPTRIIGALTNRELTVKHAFKDFTHDPAASDVQAACPACGARSGIETGYVYLRAGFNGIGAGDTLDVDALQCPACSAVIEYPSDHNCESCGGIYYGEHAQQCPLCGQPTTV